LIGQVIVIIFDTILECECDGRADARTGIPIVAIPALAIH